MFTPRLKTAIILGALLGVFCVIGVGFRVGFRGKYIFLLAMWYNRLLMGIVIGLLANKKKLKVIIRGASLGLLVSLAFFLSTGFQDPTGFLAGIIYGIIIDYVSTNYSDFILELSKKITSSTRSEI